MLWLVVLNDPLVGWLSYAVAKTLIGWILSPLAYSVLIPAVAFYLSANRAASLAGITQSGFISPLLYQLLLFIYIVQFSALNAKSPLSELVF